MFIIWRFLNNEIGIYQKSYLPERVPTRNIFKKPKPNSEPENKLTNT